MAGKSAFARKFATLVGSGALVGAGPAAAADWAVEPEVSVVGEYNDNYRLNDVPGQDIIVSGAVVDAKARFAVDTQANSFYVTPRIRSTFYPGDSDEEGDSYYVRLGGKHLTETSATSFTANYYQEEPIWGYMPSTDVGDVLGDPTRGESIGSAQVRQQAERFDFAPAFNVALSQRFDLELRAEYIDVSYSPDLPQSNESYAYLGGTAGLGYKMTDTDDLRFIAGYAKFEPDEGIDTDGYAFNAEWARKTSETQQFYVRAGANRIQTAAEAGEGDLTWETGFSGGAGVRWTFAVTEIFLDATHYADPSSSGSVVIRDQVQFRLSRRLGPVTNVWVGARAITDSGVGNSSDYVETDYATGSVGFDWRFTRQFSLAGAYTYIYRKYADADSSAQSNAVNLGVSYAPKRL